MDKTEAIELLKNMHWSITTKMNGEVPSSLALNMAIASLDKDTNVPSKSTLDHIHNVVAENEYKRGYEQGKADMAHTIKGKTLFIKVSEEDVDRIKMVMLDCDPWCKTFYEDAPGEAHWVKHETFDDGETYECDHCGVEWQFNDGGPEENEAYYCPKCGFKMERGEADGTD